VHEGAHQAGARAEVEHAAHVGHGYGEIGSGLVEEVETRDESAALAAAAVEALQAVHFQRCTPAAVRPDFFIGARQIGQSLALGERDLTR